MKLVVEWAKAFAIAAHEATEQKRKYTLLPYWTHCEEVAIIVANHGEKPGTDEMVAAAWLHDVIEDTKISAHVIRRHFGEHITNLVLDMTDVSKPEDGNRAKRKHIDLLHTSMASPEAKTIKLADLISNAQSIEKHDKDFARIYMKEKRELLKVLREGDPVLWKKAHEIVDGYFRKLIREKSGDISSPN